MTTYITEHSESDTRTSYPISHKVYEGKTKICDSVLIADSPTYGRMLFLDGELQSASHDEVLYHESLVHVAMAGGIYNTDGRSPHILVVGGGEGATVREVLRWNPASVDWVDIDMELVLLCNEHLQWGPDSLTDPRVVFHPVDIRDAISHLPSFDVIILDLPDPDGDTGYLYSTDFWKELREHLVPGGRLVTHIGPVRPYGNIGNGFQRIRETMNQAGLSFHSNGFYSICIPSFQSEWGFYIWVKEGGVSNSRDPFDFMILDQPTPLPTGLRVIDEIKIWEWATSSLLWRNALPPATE
jgi:spermidine synthase